MTYCVAMCLDEGLVFLSDTRTNAGVDHISTFRKMNTYIAPGERVLVLLTSGNLAVSQAVLHYLQARIDDPEDRGLLGAATMVEAVRMVGDALRAVHAQDGQALADFGVEFAASFIFGGQIGQQPPRLFQVYAAGNFIEASPDTPYFQIGEAKYGKPIIDRVIRRNTSLQDAAKCALISMDSTIRSNLSVGLPLDILLYPSGKLLPSHHARMDTTDPYYACLRQQWSERLNKAFEDMPAPQW